MSVNSPVRENDIDRRGRIKDQLDELLASPPFRTSKRCQSLLSYVVSETLADRAARLKERTIGVDVFGREPSYDTNHDAVVRNAAAEVRKRLAQFYIDREHDTRIELPLGSYVPIFVDPILEKPPTVVERVEAPISRSYRVWYLMALLAVAASLIAWRLATPSLNRSLDQFWKPVLNEREALQLCVGQPLRLYTFTGDRAPELQKLMDDDEKGTANLAELQKVQGRYLYLRDAEAMLKLSTLLQSKGKAYVQRVGTQTPYSDLKGFPVVLIGAFNNQWTMKLTSDLRYYFSANWEARTFSVVDRVHSEDRRWTVPERVSRTGLTEDYALVTRVLDPITERTVISVAGITDYGTLAAAEFVTDPAYLQNAFRNAPRNWSAKNVQIVLKTRIVAETPGPISVEAMYFWN